VYELGSGRLLFVATDRISAFDWVMPNGIPDKGRILTGISAFWFRELEKALGVRHHLISTELDDAGLELSAREREQLRGRSMIVKKTAIVPYECVARGYLAGSGWKEYRTSGMVCGVMLPGGLVESSRLPESIFTPATKAETGHDENVSFERMAQSVGFELAHELRNLTLRLYGWARGYAEEHGLILADTKFEFGLDGGGIVLADEVLTPDSSRYWPLSGYRPGGPQPSFDKQYLRDWLEGTGWDKASEPPELPLEVVERTRARYIEAYERLLGERFPW
jgi:phosphoribosylaminoimidazole-succinocarboxamide synthase